MTSRARVAAAQPALLPFSTLPSRQGRDQLDIVQSRALARLKAVASRDAQVRRTLTCALVLVAAMACVYTIAMFAPTLPAALMRRSRLALTASHLPLAHAIGACVPLRPASATGSASAHIADEHVEALNALCDAYTSAQARCLPPLDACTTHARDLLLLTVFIRDETVSTNKFAWATCDYTGMLYANRAVYAAVHGYTSLVIDDDAVVRWQLPLRVVEAHAWDAADDAALSMDANVSARLLQPFNYHGRRWQPHQNTDGNVRPASWAKVAAMLHVMKRRDVSPQWIFLIDADAVITNFAMSMDDVLEQAVSAGADIVCTRDRMGLNAGLLLIRNTPWSRAFLRFVWRMTSFVHELTWEQAAMSALLAAQPRLLQHLLFLPQRRLNAYLPDNPDTAARWQRGDFLVHFAGVRSPEFAELASNLSLFLPPAWPTHAACVKPSTLSKLWGW